MPKQQPLSKAYLKNNSDKQFSVQTRLHKNIGSEKLTTTHKGDVSTSNNPLLEGFHVKKTMLARKKGYLDMFLEEDSHKKEGNNFLSACTS